MAATTNQVENLSQRLYEVWETCGDESLLRLSRGSAPDGMAEPVGERQWIDAVSSCLMRCFKNTGDTNAFSLLFELNRKYFFDAIRSNLARSDSPVDPNDVLQEVFLNIYRYPTRFVCERAESFRNWGHRIVRNTLIGSLDRERRQAPAVEELDHHVDPSGRNPYRATVEAESANLVDFAYLVYLNLYIRQYERLTDKERAALRLVEIEGASYRVTAETLGIQLTSLKMVMFRSRRKIQRGLHRTLQSLALTDVMAN